MITGACASVLLPSSRVIVFFFPLHKYSLFKIVLLYPKLDFHLLVH